MQRLLDGLTAVHRNTGNSGRVRDSLPAGRHHPDSGRKVLLYSAHVQDYAELLPEEATCSWPAAHADPAPEIRLSTPLEARNARALGQPLRAALRGPGLLGLATALSSHDRGAAADARREG
jgi:hypothetical protein